MFSFHVLLSIAIEANAATHIILEISRSLSHVGDSSRGVQKRA